MDDYWDEYDDLGIGAPARAAGLVMITRSADTWSVRQTFDDPAGDRDWGISADIDLRRVRRGRRTGARDRRCRPAYRLSRACGFLIGLVTCLVTHDGISAVARSGWLR